MVLAMEGAGTLIKEQLRDVGRTRLADGQAVRKQDRRVTRRLNKRWKRWAKHAQELRGSEGKAAGCGDGYKVVHGSWA